jgi:hypothetical protein
MLYVTHNRDGTELAIAEMLRSGTTCFTDMYFYPEESAKVAERTGTLQECYRSVTRVLQECYKSITRVSVTRVLQGCYESVTDMYLYPEEIAKVVERTRMALPFALLSPYSVTCYLLSFTLWCAVPSVLPWHHIRYHNIGIRAVIGCPVLMFPTTWSPSCSRVLIKCVLSPPSLHTNTAMRSLPPLP